MSRFYLLLFLIPICVINAQVMENAPVEHQRMIEEMFNIIEGRTDDSWISGMQSLKNSKPIIFGDCLKRILKHRRVMALTSTSDKPQYLGFQDIILRHAVIYAIRYESGLPSLNSALKDMLTLEAEGKTTARNQAKDLAEELVKNCDFSREGTLQRVLWYFDSDLRMMIYQSAMSSWENEEIPSDVGEGFLRFACDTEKNHALKKKLVEFLLKMGSSPGPHPAWNKQEAGDEIISELKRNSEENPNQLSMVKGNGDRGRADLASRSAPIFRDGRKVIWLQLTMILIGCAGFLGATLIWARNRAH